MNRIVTWIVDNDTLAFRYVNHRLRCRFFDFLLPKITHLGGATLAISFLILTYFLSSSTVQRWTIEAFISLVLSHILAQIIKRHYSRVRPFELLKEVHLCTNLLKDYSFPSGHTTAAFSIAIVFSLYSLSFALVLLPIAILIGFSRVYIGLHYPTDCFIGALIGTVTGLLVVIYL